MHRCPMRRHRVAQLIGAPDVAHLFYGLFASYGRQHSRSPAEGGGPTHGRGDHLASGQRRKMALDPGRVWRLAPRLLAVSPMGGPRGLGKHHGQPGGRGGATTGVCLRRLDDRSCRSERVRRPFRQRSELNLRLIRGVANPGGALGRSRGGLGPKIVGVCDAAGRLLDFLFTPGQAHELAPSLTLLRRLPHAP